MFRFFPADCSKQQSNQRKSSAVLSSSSWQILPARVNNTLNYRKQKLFLRTLVLMTPTAEFLSIAQKMLAWTKTEPPYGTVTGVSTKEHDRKNTPSSFYFADSDLCSFTMCPF